MKKLIALILSCIMFLSVLTLVGCDVSDSGSDTSEQTEAPATDTQAVADGGTGTGGTRNMTAAELYAGMKALGNSINTCELSGDYTETVEGEKVKNEMVVKLGDGVRYVKMSTDGETVLEVTMTKDMTYVSGGGMYYKYKPIENDPIFPEDILTDSDGDESSSLPEEKINAATVYSVGGEQYFSISLTPEEAEAADYQKEKCDITYYFDMSGVVKGMTAVQESYSEHINVDSINKPVTVEAPNDNNIYIEKATSNSFDREGYAQYLKACKIIEDAKTYCMTLSITQAGEGQQITHYEKDIKGNELLSVNESGVDIDIYHYGEKYYASDNGSSLQELNQSAIDGILGSFESMATLKDSPATPINVIQIDELEYQYSSALELYAVAFISGSSSNGSYFECAFDKDFKNIHFYIEAISNGQTASVVEFSFSYIDDATHLITLPQ